MKKKRIQNKIALPDAGMTRRRRIITVTLITVAYLAVILTVALIYRKELAKYIDDPSLFREWIDGFGFIGQLVYVVITAVQVMLAVIPDGPLQVAGGYAFGTLYGTILFIAGYLIGSAIAFILSRRYGRFFISLFFAEEKYERFFDDIKGKNLYVLVFLLYLVPGSPKDMLTYCFGTTKIKMHYFLLLSGIGRTPAVLLTQLIAHNIVNRNTAMILYVISIMALLFVMGRIVLGYLRSHRN